MYIKCDVIQNRESVILKQGILLKQFLIITAFFEGKSHAYEKAPAIYSMY